MELKDITTSVGAIVGMALGIYNFLRARSSDRVRLQVVPRASSFQGQDHSGRQFYFHSRDRYDLNHPTAPPDTLSLEIVNLSKFAVVVDQVGLKPFLKRKRIALVNPVIPDGKPWPRKLEPRESVTVFFDVANLLTTEHIQSVTRAYASTACGATCYGTSGALREFVANVCNVA